MPWIRQEDCDGCGICVDMCRADAIIMEETSARINMDLCIRCGTCHDICPLDAVRHDSELIPMEVETNYQHACKLLEHYQVRNERRQFLGRMVKHYNKERIVAERSIERIQRLITEEKV